jgi:hypothetical protein
VSARLVPEADNPYDDHAVRVEIVGRKVGHLSRADARRYRTVHADQPLSVRALIVGGWDQRYRGEPWKGETGKFGVRIAFNIEDG